MFNKKYNGDLVNIQESIRNTLISRLYKFDLSNVEDVLTIEEEIISKLDKLVKATQQTTDGEYFKCYKYLVLSLFHLLKWAHKELNALDGRSHLNASITNIDQIELDNFNHIPDFKDDLQNLFDIINKVTKVAEVKDIVETFLKISFPSICEFDSNPFEKQNAFPSQNIDEKESRIIILSVQFTIDGEPWSNPQILKPNELYSIYGKLTINEWPEGFDTLILQPVSTSSNEWFSLSIPEIKKLPSNEYNVKGQVVFKYSQSSYDELLSIKLLASFHNSTNKVEYPSIIGYDQLIFKVLDPNSSYFPTGYKNLNTRVLYIINTITKELPNIDKEEKDNFLKLLTGIVNFQGFCLQQGKYKEVDSIAEDVFRDHMIQHLIAIPNLGEEIIKEAHLGGGRVEIGYRGLIAELKVENSISDRDKLYTKYSKQPTAYSSSNTKQLSILCILDLTEKKLPPAAPQNNIELLTPEVHGFVGKVIEYPPKLVMIIIDGNTKKPSDYSK